MFGINEILDKVVLKKELTETETKYNNNEANKNKTEAEIKSIKDKISSLKK